jgi:hypothetical protein
MTSDVGVLVLSQYDARIAGGQDSSVFIPVKGRAFLCEVYRCTATRRKPLPAPSCPIARVGPAPTTGLFVVRGDDVLRPRGEQPREGGLGNANAPERNIGSCLLRARSHRRPANDA